LAPPKNVEILGFRDDYQDQLINSLGAVVPFHGGAGMQSKVFEPLTLGVPLVANPKSLVGFPYEQGVHFMAVRTAKEYVVAMLSLFSNMNLRQELSSNAQKRSSELFGDDKILNKIEWVISDQQNI
jgi:glycosyltransferase involved in cell wall biosynthesis